jgi:UDP-N-acetylmuramate dehydrogenase
MARFTTVRTGGPAEYFARAGEESELRDLVAWAVAQKIEINVVGSGSNLLVADDGVRGLVLKLDGDLARIEVDGTRIVCGAGARLPAVAARAAREGLSGIEFGVNIPGTVGGAVRMNAGAYGREMREALVAAVVVSAAGTRSGGPDELGLRYRGSDIASGEVVARAVLRLTPADPLDIRATIRGMQDLRTAAQPRKARTFGSVFKNPPGDRTSGQLLEACGLKGFTVGGARISGRHANFIENDGTATSADVVALMAEARRRVREQFGIELEHEVELLGDIAIPV